MRVIHTVQAMKHERTHWLGRVGFVPTMGYLHEGHLSLFQRARSENEILVASIFVNPTQFGPHEDFSRYPRNIEHDLYMLETIGVDAVFLPDVDEIYPRGFATYVEPQGPLTDQCEGALRPGHFRGVATVVLKLFHIIQPHHAYFGQKDAQQAAVIRQMIADLNLPVTLHILPTMREPDGLAMSSRNSYLTPQERTKATLLYRALLASKTAFGLPTSMSPQAIRQAMVNVIANEPMLQLDYAEVRDAQTFLPLETLQAPAILLIAARIGSTRLIDNFVLRPDGTWDTGIFAGDDLHTTQLRENRENNYARESNSSGYSHTEARP